MTKNARMGTATATASKPTLVKSDEVWFDDVEQQALDRVYGQQISAQATERSLLDSSKKKLGRYLAVDCEMVGVGPDGVESALARVVVVNYHGAVLMDKYVRPQERVTDFRTAISGIEPKHLRDAHDFAVVQREVAELFKDRILVGHGLKNDLKVGVDGR